MVKGKKVKVTEETNSQSGAADPQAEPTVEEGGEQPVAETAAEDSQNDDRSVDELRARLEQAEEEARKNYDRFVRASAELDNFKKRAAREMEEFRKFSTEKLIKELLPVVDNLERALVSAEDPSAGEKGLREGVDLTLREILRVLERFGVQSIQSLNEPFDPAYHQAMMQEPRDNVPANTVINELQKGYTMHDRLLRPSMVVVSAPTAPQKNDAGESG